MTDAEIGSKLGVGTSTVRRWRRDFVIVSRATGKRGAVQGANTVVTPERLRDAVAQAFTFTEVAYLLGVPAQGNRHSQLKRRAAELGLDTSHFTPGKCRNALLGTHGHRRWETSELLVAHGPQIASLKLKKRLLAEKILQNVCATCGLPGVWEGKALSLQLHHANGDKNDNRLVNIQLLCSNCHSQTATFAGRNKQKRPKT